MDAFDIVVTVQRALRRDRQRLVLENLALKVHPARGPPEPLLWE